MRKAVILIAYHFPPDPSVGGQRLLRFHKYLGSCGYTSHVLTAAEQQPGSTDIQCIPNLFEQRRRDFWWHAERLARKVAVPGDVGLVWSMRAARACRDVIQRRALARTAVLCSFPPLGTHLAGLLLGADIPWIADFRDPYANELSRVLHWTRGQRVIASWLEKIIIRRATLVIANTDVALEEWKMRYPAHAHKFRLVWNGFDPEETIAARPLTDQTVKSFVHIGTLYAGRHPNQILESLSRLRSRNLSAAAGVRFSFIGNYQPESAAVDQTLLAQGIQEGWIEIRQPLPRPQAQQVAAEAHGLILLQPQSQTQVPAKLFEYVRIGRPILACVPRQSAVERILERTGIPCELIYPDDAPDAADAKLARFLEWPPSTTRPNAWFEENFNGASQARTLSRILDEALGLDPAEPALPVGSGSTLGAGPVSD